MFQQALTKKGFKKQLPIERLSKCKYQDNLEIIQWLKSILSQHDVRDNYDPEKRRKGQQLTYLQKKNHMRSQKKYQPPKKNYEKKIKRK